MGVAASTPQRGGVEARGQVVAGTWSTTDAEPESADDVLGPQGAGRGQPVDEVVDAAVRVLGQELDDAVRDVRGVGRRAPLVPDDAERFVGGLRPFGGLEDLAREVAARRAEEPGGPDDPDPPARTGSVECLGRRPLTGQLRGAVRVRGTGRVVGPVPDAVEPRPVEHLVGRDHDEVDATCGAGVGEDAGRDPVPAQGEVGVAGAAVDIGPRGAMDDDLGAVVIEPCVDVPRGVEVERRAIPRQGPERTGERCVGEGRDHRRPEATGRAGDGDPHQGVARSRSPYCRS